MFIREGIDNFWILNWLDEFMMGHKGFICGGCFKNIFNKEKVKDLDIFFEKASDFDEAVEYFDSRTLGYEGNDKQEEEYTFYYENEKVKAYKHIRTGTVIELCSNIYGKPEEILSRFDFTVTKFAYYKAEIEDEIGEEYVSEVDPFEKVADTHIEYMRVLEPDGILVFKWNEDQIKLNDVLKEFGKKPLLGDQRGKTRWILFMK
jgi:hypothetical protein